MGRRGECVDPAAGRACGPAYAALEWRGEPPEQVIKNWERSRPGDARKGPRVLGDSPERFACPAFHHTIRSHIDATKS